MAPWRVGTPGPTANGCVWPSTPRSTHPGRSQPLLLNLCCWRPYPRQLDTHLTVVQVSSPNPGFPHGFQRENQVDAAKGRVYLLNDKMPTGLLVRPGMNHGGPFPATGHPGFTAVGIPAELRDQNPNLTLWRLVGGEWTRGNVTKAG